MVKSLSAMQEIWVRSLGLEDPLEKEWLPTSVLLPRESHGQRSLEGCSAWGHKESDMTERLNTFGISFHSEMVFVRYIFCINVTFFESFLLSNISIRKISLLHVIKRCNPIIMHQFIKIINHTFIMINFACKKPLKVLV